MSTVSRGNDIPGNCSQKLTRTGQRTGTEALRGDINVIEAGDTGIGTNYVGYIKCETRCINGFPGLVLVLWKDLLSD